MLVYFRMVVRRMTDRAALVSEDNDESEAIWLPLSQIEIEPGPIVNGVKYSDVTMPEWLAVQRGLF